jgi:hypothetical protein
VTELVVDERGQFEKAEDRLVQRDVDVGTAVGRVTRLPVLRAQRTERAEAALKPSATGNPVGIGALSA